jgi:hypothetical protein
MRLSRLFCGAALAAALLTAPAPVWAQDGGGKGNPGAPDGATPPKDGARRGEGGGSGSGRRQPRGPYDADDLKQKLGLSDEQRDKVKAAVDAFRASLREKLKEVTERDARRAATKEAREALDQKIEGMLDDAQRAKFAEIRKGAGTPRSRSRDPKKEGDAGKPGDPKPEGPAPNGSGAPR